MKLRNKKTGEIVDLTEGHICETNYGKHLTISPIAILNKHYDYNSLAELNEEWEDYEEPKDRWYINENGGVLHYIPDDLEGEDLVYNKYQDEIGNHFETEEKAEKAVEKLKAWKRLKDKGFRFTGVGFRTSEKYVGKISFMSDGNVCIKDLDLLFAGEDEE